MGSHGIFCYPQFVEDFSSDLRNLRIFCFWAGEELSNCRWSLFLGVTPLHPQLKYQQLDDIEISMAGWKGDFLATWNMMKHVLDLKQQTGCLFFFSSLTFTLFVSPPPPTWCYLLTRMGVADASVENEMLSVCRMHLDPRHVSVGSITFYYVLLWSWPHFGQWFKHHQPFSADAWV